jgi:hypothetical protein
MTALATGFDGTTVEVGGVTIHARIGGDPDGPPVLPWHEHTVQVPVVARGGERALGEPVGQTVARVADHVDAAVVPGCGHFLPEEAPDEIVRRALDQTERSPS